MFIMEFEKVRVVTEFKSSQCHCVRSGVPVTREQELTIFCSRNRIWGKRFASKESEI